MSWYFKVLKQYADFKGRARRKEYWYFFLFNLIATISLVVVDVVFGFFSIEGGMGLLSGLYTLAVIIPSLAVSVRRLHDQNRSGWWMLVSLVPLIGGIIITVMMLLKGTAGGNVYGADPLAG